MTIKSTWLEYDGYIMRSRAETRLAAILDGIGVSYVYEHMPYSHRGYLPDFYLPHLDVFIEVKGKKPTAEEKAKCERLFADTGCTVLIVYGSPNLFMHHDHLDGYVRKELGWMPMIFGGDKWGELSINLICRLIYHVKGKVAGEKFVAAFATDGASRTQACGPALLQWHDDLARKIGKTARLIYEHNEPRTAAKLSSLPPATEYESVCIEYLNKQQSKEAA